MKDQPISLNTLMIKRIVVVECRPELVVLLVSKWRLRKAKQQLPIPPIKLENAV